MKLPTKLEIVPIAEAIFELRYTAMMPAASLLPGVFMSKLDITNVEKTPVSQLPDAVRQNDANLRHQALVRLSWSGGSILIGDYSIMLSANTPYPGWDSFEKSILKVVQITKESNIIRLAERVSLRYINVVAANTVDEQLSKLSIQTTIGGKPIGNLGAYNIRFETRAEGMVNIVSAGAPAFARTPEGKETKGALIDVDSIAHYSHPEDLDQFLSDFPGLLKKVRASNKTSVFSCLTDEAIRSLGPIYE